MCNEGRLSRTREMKEIEKTGSSESKEASERRKSSEEDDRKRERKREIGNP